MSSDDQGFDKEVDVLIVGSGGGGFTAALTANHFGLDTLLIEKAGVFGGTTALSGGGAWLPDSPTLLREGHPPDDRAETLAYLKRLAGERYDESRSERYLEAAPEMSAFLEQLSPWLADGFFWIKGYSDYHPDKGGDPLGRGVWAKPLDLKNVGPEADQIRRPLFGRAGVPRGAWMTSIDYVQLVNFGRSGVRGKLVLARLAKRILRHRLLGERMATSGQALIMRLRLALRDAGVPLWLNTPLKSLITDASGGVVGAQVEHDGTPMRIRARHGVVLTTGGFDHNPELRKRHHPEIEHEWSMGSPDNTGDGIQAGSAVGAATDLMDHAWWMPGVKLPTGAMFGLLAERQSPGGFIVNGEGRRFVNEATPYVTFGDAQIEDFRRGHKSIPAFMVFDSRAWKRNIYGTHLPIQPMPKGWLESGFLKRADTLEELAEIIGVPPQNLLETQRRFNELARKGVDEDFGKGSNPYDRFYGDPTLPNPCLAEVSEAPFYAWALLPGDIGTSGGLVIDADARVLREDGEPIPGLYASGNTTASVLGGTYPGPGATIGPAMAFAYIAAKNVAATAGRTGDGADATRAATPTAPARTS